MTGNGQHDTGRTPVSRGSLSFDDAVSKCAILSSFGQPQLPRSNRRTEDRRSLTTWTFQAQIKLS